MPTRTLEVRVGDPTAALDRFEDAWNAAAGRGVPPAALLSFPDLARLLAALTPARWQMLQTLRAAGAMSVRALSVKLGRDYKNVHTDVSRFVELGLVAKRDDGKVEVPWEAVRAELRLETEPG